MRIDFTRTGGFAGMRLTISVDTQELAPDQASNLTKLVSDAAFFDLPERIMPEAPGPDRFEYMLTIAESKKTHSVLVHDAAAPESLRPLLNYLTTLAMVSKKR
jgi:emfourin